MAMLFDQWAHHPLDDEKREEASEHRKLLKRNLFFCHQRMAKGKREREEEKRAFFCYEACQRRRKEDRTERQKGIPPYEQIHQLHHPRHRAAFCILFKPCSKWIVKYTQENDIHCVAPSADDYEGKKRPRI